MAESLEYIKLKLYLYKYTPDFNYHDINNSTNSDKIDNNKAKIATLQNQIDKLNKQITDYNSSQSTAIANRNSATLVKVFDSMMDQLNKDVGTLDEFNSENRNGMQYFQSLYSITGNAYRNLSYSNLYGTTNIDFYTTFMCEYFLNNKLTSEPTLRTITNYFQNIFNSENKPNNDSVGRNRQVMWQVIYNFFKNNVKPIKLLNVDAINKQIADLQKQINDINSQQLTITSNLGRIQRFDIELDDKYLSKVDITDFLTGYNYTQSLNGTISWNINLYNGVLNESQMDFYFASQPDSGITTQIPKYESEEDNYIKDSSGILPSDQDIDRITECNKNRANNVTKYLTTVQATDYENAIDLQNRKPVLLLSDLIQKYDFVSLYIYKSPNPIQESDIDGNSSDIFASQLQGAFSVPLDNEFFLEVKHQLSNEFNGFVFEKDVNEAIGQLNTLSISGTGVLGLLDRTKILYQPTLFTSSLYDQLEIYDRNQIAIFSNLFVDKTITQTLDILFKSVFRITSQEQNILNNFNIFCNEKINAINNDTQAQLTLLNTQVQNKINSGNYSDTDIKKMQDAVLIKQANLIQTCNSAIQYQSCYGRNFGLVDNTSKEAFNNLQIQLANINKNYYFDIPRMIVENKKQINTFNIPSYIYATVMKNRGFCFNNISGQYTLGIAASIPTNTKSLGNDIDKAFLNTNNINISGLWSIINNEIDTTTLKAYFTFLDNGFANFYPALKTPNEIINEIKTASMIEIYENRNSTITFRTPKYNDDSTTILLNNIAVINRSYKDSASNVLSREKLAYRPPMVDNVPFQVYSYVNGKLLIQNGLNEGEAATNPNVSLAINKINADDKTKSSGIFNYCRMYLELNNAGQKTCSITTEYIPGIDYTTNQSVQVGNLMYDDKHSKIFYITSIQRSCQVGGDLRMVINGTYVRDCLFDELGNTFNFRKLPELEKLNEIFGNAQ